MLAVWRLDRLGRSMPHLIETIGALEARGVGGGGGGGGPPPPRATNSFPVPESP
ncbi:recombinase family protein [Citrobacter portucalensis]